VALNLGGGRYRDVSSLIPASQQTTRSYAIAAGDLLGDGRAEIILPDQNDGANTALLRWNGNGFDEIRNWIPQSIWKDAPALLNAQSWMSLADFDRDGRLDLLVTGQQGNPNFQIVFGGPSGFTADSLVVLPDGPFGHTQDRSHPVGTLTTAEVSPAVVADFNNDGLPDIFAAIRNITLFANGSFFVGDATYAVRLNHGSRRFIDATPSPYPNRGPVGYQNLMTVDINNDGFLDIVGTYAADPPRPISPHWGTTVFLNDGTGAFQLVDGAQLIGATTTPPDGRRWNLGSFVPTVIGPGRTEGIVYESVGGCGTPGCPAVGLNLYKVTANGALGTGPNFVDPATLGVPGFNEFYYLRQYPDATAAVQAGQYESGLAHYLAVGRTRGYRTSASSADAPNTLTAAVAGSSVTLSWIAPLNATVTAYLVEAGSAPGLSDLARFTTGTPATSLSTSGVPSGTYYVRVKTISGTATSGPSNEVVATVGSGACTVGPLPPANLASAVSGSSVLLHWSAGGGSPQSYVLEAGSLPGLADVARLDLGRPATTFTAGNIPSGRYYVRVRATNACGTSNQSNEILVVVRSAALPDAPKSLAATVAGSTVTLTWIAPLTSVTSYLVEAGSAPGLSDLARLTTGSTATSFSTSGVPSGRYFVRVRTMSGIATSGPSNEVVVAVGPGLHRVPSSALAHRP
jgi:FG-GAP-like repeat